MSWLLYRLGTFWAYATLGATSIVVEEFAPVTGGVAAHEQHLRLVWVAVSCGIGSWIADIALYLLGRWRGVWVRRRWPRLGRALTRTLMGVRRAPWRSSLAVRYAYGLRLTLPIACGAAHVPLAEYLAGSGISAFTWASLFTVIGWVFGRSAALVMHHVRRYEDVVGLAVAGLLGILLLFYVRRTADQPEDPAARAFERELDVLSGEHPVIDPDVPSGPTGPGRSGGSGGAAADQQTGERARVADPGRGDRGDRGERGERGDEEAPPRHGRRQA